MRRLCCYTELMEQKKILIVDDSGSMRNILDGMLREAGFEHILVASGGKEAIEVFGKENPDLVLLDIIMPEVNGMDVLRLLAGRGKVLVVSAVGQDSIVEEAMGLGAVGYLVKPLNAKELETAVRSALA